MSKRINVTVSDGMNELLDSTSDRWGCTKSDLVAVILGQYFDGFDKTKLSEIKEFSPSKKRRKKSDPKPNNMKIEYEVRTKY